MATTIFTVGLLRDFVAQHRLIGGDWGRENDRHSHAYKLEALFEGDTLDQHGYLIDISKVEPRLDNLVTRYRDQMLNELPEFEGENPGWNGSPASSPSAWRRTFRPATSKF